ncbi:MAG: class I SAM-dependent methyltransferase, partial [Marinilabiliaceae bacterium]
MADKKLLETGASTHDYYQSINKVYRKLYHKLLMLHYPFFKQDGESLEKRQVNLTDHCISHVPSLENMDVLELGCGNGAQSLYIYENFHPKTFTGIDINAHNIELARSLNGTHQNLNYFVDDAQAMANVPDNSVDVLLCIESAFHYPDKPRFLKEVRRVLKPSGTFLIADILSHSQKNRLIMEKWKKKMNFHHWTKSQYLKAFEDHGLELKHKEDITGSVKDGYKGHNDWVSRHKFNNFFGYLSFKLFVFIQVTINLLLLKSRRQYYIFV